MSTSLRIAAAATVAATVAATNVAAQETPIAPDVSSQYTLVEANPDNVTATIATEVNGGPDYVTTLDCDTLAHQQKVVEQDIIRNAATFIAWGLDDERYQTTQLELGFGHTTLGDVYRYASNEIIERDEKYSGLTNAAHLGADRQVFVDAQREAGCHKPRGLTPKPTGQ